MTIIYPAGKSLLFDGALSPSDRKNMASTAGRDLPQFSVNDYDGTSPYVDPFPGLKGTDKIWAACFACDGSGLYELPTWITDGMGRPYCFKCEGVGGRETTVSNARASIRRKITAHTKRQERAEQQRKTWEAGEAARQAKAKEAADRAASQLESAEARLALLDVTLPEGTKLHGIPVTVARTATYLRDAYNSWEAPEVVAVVTFRDEQGVDYVWHSSSNAAFGIDEGDAGNLFGTVKKTSIYRNDAQVVITRARLKDLAASSSR